MFGDGARVDYKAPSCSDTAGGVCNCRMCYVGMLDSCVSRHGVVPCKK